MPFTQMAKPAVFSTLRDYLSNCGFSEAAVRDRLGLATGIELDLSRLTSLPVPQRRLADRLDALIFLFLLGEFMLIAECESFFPAAVWSAMTELELVQVDKTNAERCFASVALYPIQDLFIASDRWNNPDHSPRQSFPDIVYPALTGGALEFLDTICFEPCENFLEICAGTATAALLAAKTAKHVWATDIAERSISFAKFNAALNGVGNITFAQGDLYEAVKEEVFDRIVAHPPYVPVLRPEEIYYGGGEDGEEITRRIIADLPGHLRPGGRLYCRALGTDRPGSPFEDRVRQWLREKHGEFDIALIVLRSFQPKQFALNETVRRRGGLEHLADWDKVFAKLQVEEMIIGLIVVQRVTGARRPFMIRRAVRDGARREAIEWALRWETQMKQPDAVERLLLMCPHASQRAELNVRHRVCEGEFIPEQFTLAIDSPFNMECKVQPWMPLLLARCDGKTTISQLFEISKQNQWILPETPREEFARLLGVWISGGFLLTEELKLPAAAG